MNSKLYSILILTFIISFSVSHRASILINFAKQFLGDPYFYSTEIADFSEFIGFIYWEALGLHIGTTTKELIKEGRQISKDELQPGDLIFENDQEVTLYIGNNQVIRAPPKKGNIIISNSWSFWKARRIVDFDESVKSVFDADFYSYKYDDLNKAFGNNKDKLYNHFITIGIKEGRAGSPAFDLTYYLEHNADLKKTFGTDYEAAYNHFITLGINEDRDLSPVFHLGYYKEHNFDIVDVCGKANPDGIMGHFLEYGMDEGRISSPNFDVKYYKKRNKDLQKDFGDNLKKYYYHYCKFSEIENRKGKESEN